jgi:hypothetical protein
MRHTFWLLIVLAGTGGAQWRHFGEGRQAVAPSSLARGMLAAHNAVRARVGIAPLAHLLHHVGGSHSFQTGCSFETGLVTRFLSA